ncbi:MAG: DUF2279 domain-containing protein [Flavobacteriales bacterium]
MRAVILLITLNCPIYLGAQDSINSKKLWTVGGGMLATQGITIAGLNEVWYKNQPRSSFHFFNDNREWLQMDKAGHAYSAYQLARVANRTFLWAGMVEKKSALWGSLAGWASISTFEVLDGFSEAWGFSWGDIAANTLGAGLFLGQELAWREQRIQLKFSSSPTPIAAYRPNLLGNSYPERLLKDYNGQTYWLSFTPFKKENENKMPNWISVSLGYSAYGMTGGFDNYNVYCNGDPDCFALKRYRQLYLSLDVDWNRIKTGKKSLKTLFFLLNSIKIPFPAMEFSQNKVSLRALMF